MKTIYKVLFLVPVIMIASCQDIVEGINDNPNQFEIDDVDANALLTGAMLANTSAQLGHLNRISGLWSGQLTGFTSLYSNIYGYSISTAESVSTWNQIYIGVMTNVRRIQSEVTDDDLTSGIARVLEAHAIGTAAAIFGDVPYSQAAQIEQFEDPAFDNQDAVLTSAISLLDEAIGFLSTASTRTLLTDIYFQGNATGWLESAYTLQARYHMLMKNYGAAYTSAQNGISSADNSMMYTPRGDAARAEGDKNLFWTILEGARAGDIGTGNSYMMQLMNDTTDVYRGNAKTNETARFGYFTIDEEGGSDNSGIVEQFEPQPLITFQENQLILAEAAARTVDFDTALGHLNDLRAYLNTGAFLNTNFDSEPFQYDAYVAADFAAGGMENADGIADIRALLREIVEERFISGFGTFMAFNDARRLRKDDGDISVPFPLNPSSATQHPERFPYSFDEINANSNGPDEDPGIYLVTRVNQ